MQSSFHARWRSNAIDWSELRGMGVYTRYHTARMNDLGAPSRALVERS